MGRILVAGATGNVGRLVVDELLALGATDVRALTTSPDKAALPSAVDVRTGFIGRPETLPDALEGVDVLYLPPWPDTVETVVELARQAGVRHVVVFSSLQAESENDDDLMHAHFRRVEVAVERSGLAWTHIRGGEYMTNFEHWFDRIRDHGVVPMPYPEAGAMPIDLGDIARVAAIALLEGGHEGRIHTLTGPETLQHQEIAHTIADALGTTVRIEPQSREDAIAEFGEYREAGEWYVDGLRQMIEHPPQPSADYRRVTGENGTTMAEWARRRAAALTVTSA